MARAEPQDFMPIFRYASERDVDVLIVEELIASRSLVEFVLATAFNQIDRSKISNWNVRHSTSRLLSRREIDIRLIASTTEGQRVCLLIENKLDESEQPGQAESYQAESIDLRTNQSFDLVSSCLICPVSYAEKNSGFAQKFDFLLSYETLKSHFEKRLVDELALDEEIVGRLAHRVSLLDQAIDKRRRGYRQIVLPEKAGFNSKYVALLDSLAPLCRPGNQMLRGDGAPAESVSMLFDALGTFREIPEPLRPRRFAHEFGRGQKHRANYVAVTFSKWGRFLKQFQAEFEKDLDGTPYELLATVTSSRPNPGLVLLERTYPINYDVSFDEQQDNIASGIQKAENLRRWVLHNFSILRRWHVMVSEQGA
jgi:hypothetical protein